MVNLINAIYQDSVFLQLLETEEKFDLILVEGFCNELVLPLIGVHKVPFVYLSTLGPQPLFWNSMDSSLAYNNFPLVGLGFSDEMTLLERTISGLLVFFLLLLRNSVILPIAVDSYFSEYFSNKTNLTLSAQEIEENYLSLIISRSSPGVNYGISKTGGIVDAGCLQCIPSQKLADDFEAFVNESGDAGFIIVSFGSILKGSNMPSDIQKIFLATFGRLRQKVIWKWEDDVTKNENIKIPSNIKLMSWLPQQDLLGHKQIRLFVTHAGLASIEEAVYHGVPLIALPVFGDQPWNAQKINKDGNGICLKWDNLSEQILYDAIQEILNNPK